MKHLLACALLLLACCSAPEPAPQISVQDAWARETVPGQASAAAYLTISNGGGNDRLIRVQAVAPVKASLHATEQSDGIARMRPLTNGLIVPREGRIELRPGGAHVMLEHLRAPLRAGDKLPLTLEFERAGARRVELQVRSASGGAAEPRHGH